jgi:hypothetical protein
MPESDNLLRKEAILGLEVSIRAIYGACIPLDGFDLDIHKKNGYTRGWKVEINVVGQRFICHLLINNSFPFSSPRFFLQDYQSFLNKIPHLGRDGLLCLGETGYDYFRGRRSVKTLHRIVYNLLEQGLSGTLNHDFRLEFLNYWSIDTEHTAYVCIKRPHTAPLKIVYCIYRGRVYFFDNTKIGLEWLRQRFSTTKDKHFEKLAKFYPTVCLPIDRIWLPSEYPKSGKDILMLTKNYGGDANYTLLECTPCSGEVSLPILFSFQSESSLTFVATKVYEPTSSRGPGKIKKARGSRIKVRSSTSIGDQGLQFFTPTTKIRNMNVQRIDSDWLHYRSEAGQSDRNCHLRDMSVAILGCGSLGAQVADILCKTGIGTMALFDPDILSWDNIYRHHLGPDYIGQNKAEALADVLRQKFPEAHIHSVSSKWEQHFGEGTEPQLLQFDLIISLIGDDENNTEQLLAYYTHKESMFPPVIFGWTEVWGAAGHALLLGHQPGDGCLMCTDNGEMQLRNIFSFESDQFINIPACNTVFAPYGFIDTLPIVSMIAELALDVFSEDELIYNYRIWIANIEKIKKNGGKINQWVKDRFSNIFGEQVIRTHWVSDKKCEVCHANQVQ